MRESLSAHAAGLLAGYAVDRWLGDPRRWHPVAGFGRLAAALERRTYRDRRVAGILHVALLVGAATGVAAVGQRLVRRRPWARLALTAAVTWSAVGGRSLVREADRLHTALAAGDLTEARRRLPSLCGRDPSSLGRDDLVRATVESVAENTSDAIVAPLCWGAVAGPVGVVAYRMINTLDAMVGHRTSRYHRFGWAAARLDDAANWVPARLTAGLAVLLAPVVGGSRSQAWAAWRRDGDHHPSPNAGQVEAAFAGALGCRLGGGQNRYGDHVDARPAMGGGGPPVVADIARTNRLATAVGAAAAVLAAAALAAAAMLRRRA